MRIKRQRLLLTCFAIAFVGVPLSTASAGNWPTWRGPTGNGISNEKGIPTEWGKRKNIAWRVELPGPGGATPVIWNDRVFVTSTDRQDLVLICLNTSGEQLWRRKVGYGNKIARADEGNAASPSPTTDGKHVWTMMTNGSLACYQMDGKEIWNINLQDRYGKFKIAFGMTSTPVVHEDRLYVQLIHGEGRAETQEALVACMNALTGEGIWKQGRVTQAHSENEHSYASPLLYDDGKRKYLVSHGADYTIAHRLSDGTELWRLGGLNPHDDPKKRYHPTLRFVASPTAVNGMIVIPTAKDGPVFAIRPDMTGLLTDNSDARLWVRARNTPDVSCPLIVGGLVYLLKKRGQMLVLNAKTGEEVYLNQPRPGVRHRASPVFADGKVFLTARDGGAVRVIKAGREFELLATNELAEDMSASPAISNGTIYLRTFDALWAVREEQ